MSECLGCGNGAFEGSVEIVGLPALDVEGDVVDGGIGGESSGGEGCRVYEWFQRGAGTSFCEGSVDLAV